MAQARQIHKEIDGEDDDHARTPESHTWPVDIGEIAFAFAVEYKQDEPEEDTMCCAEGETRDEEPLNEGGL